MADEFHDDFAPAPEPVIDDAPDLGAPNTAPEPEAIEPATEPTDPPALSAGHDVEWLQTYAAEREREVEQLRQQLAESNRRNQAPREPSSATVQQAANANPIKPGESRSDWEERIDRIVEARDARLMQAMEARLKPLTEFTQGQAHRAEVAESQARTADVISRAQGVCDHVCKTHDYLKTRPGLAKDLASEVLEDLKEWRAAYGQTADRSGDPRNYEAMAHKHFLKLIAKARRQHSHFQVEQSESAKKRQHGGAVTPSGGSGRTAQGGNKPQHSAGGNLDEEVDWLKRNAAAFGINGR